MYRVYLLFSVRKYILLTIAVCMGIVSQVVAQPITSTSIGTASGQVTGFPNPFPDAYDAARQQYLILASEMHAAGITKGKIVGIQFFFQGNGGSAITDYTISMGATNVASLSTSLWEGGLTPVYYNASQSSFGLGFQGPTFNTGSFVWDGSSNVIVEICHGGNTRVSSPVVDYYNVGSFNASHSSAQNVAGGCGSTGLTTQGTPTYRPRIKFVYYPDCVSPGQPFVDPADMKYDRAIIRWVSSSTPSPYLINYDFFLDQNPANPTGWDNTTDTFWNTEPNPPLVVNRFYLQPETKYYVHLRAHCDSITQGVPTGHTPWLLDSFTTLPACATPVVTVDRITCCEAVATWNTVPTAYDYEYAVSVDGNPPTRGTHTQSTSVKLLGLQEGKTYWVFVKAYCTPTPQSRWGKTQFHTGNALSVKETSSDNLTLAAYPNPFKNQFTIEVGNAGTEGIISITDVTGKLLQTVKLDVENRAKLDFTGFSNGLYIVRYTDNIRTKTIKITKE